jgi:D-amino-acid dehydrogenase
LNRSVTVLGAGIIGISCALELQRRGYQVRLVDRRGPGEETSSGNAGILSYSNITPLADPALLPRLHRLILNLDDDFLMHYPHLASLLPWLVRFLRRCERNTFMHDGAAMNRLTSTSVEMHKQWMAEAGAEKLLNRGGALKLYRNGETFLRDQLERELLQQCAVRHQVLDVQQAYELEPDLRPIFSCAVLIEESLSLRNPQKLCKHYARLFTEAGGQVEQAAVQSLRMSDAGWELLTDQGMQTAARVVIAMGAWTPEVISQLGYRNPLAIERGYHVMLAADGNASLSRPIFDVDASYVMAPMEAGLRVTTGTNMTRRETAPDPRQVSRVMPQVREAFPVAEESLQEPWMGRRPTLPDSLPIIGRAPRHENLWLAFGHSHMGLTMGPVTGQLIANFISGATQPFDVSSCAPSRYL